MMNDKFQVKRLHKPDVFIFQKLIILFQEVFEMEKRIENGTSYLTALLEKPGFIALCVMAESEIVGGLTAYELPMYYDEISEIFIYDIAIKPAHQGKGLGKKLLLFLEEYCRQNGISSMFVAANEEDEHALDFYHATGGKAEKVVHFNYLLNK